MRKTNETLLIVDDDKFLPIEISNILKDEGFQVILSNSPEDAIEKIQKENPDLVVLDVMLPHGNLFTNAETKGGFDTGIALARKILAEYPAIRVMAYTNRISRDTKSWFETRGLEYIRKGEPPEILVKSIRRALGKPSRPRAKIFIVHGHDEAAKLQLKNYLQNTLHFEEPIILHEQPSLGRTIIEKLEDEALNVEIVFVLLTPDDIVVNQSATNAEKRRARQNVILELGFFLGKLGRKNGRVLLLHKGETELPSDIQGLIYIDITNGVVAAGEQIRNELSEFL
jgi:CheY-like chemotaxis protein